MKLFIQRGNSSERWYHNQKDGPFFWGDKRGQWLLFPAIVKINKLNYYKQELFLFFSSSLVI